MRAPIPSFKKELAAFRARPERPCGKAVEGLLDRWLKHGQSEESWRTIRQYIPALSAEDLITQVLKARWSAAGSVARVFGTPGAQGFNAEWAEFLPTLKKRLNRKLSSSPLPLAVEVAVALELAAAEVRMIHNHYFGHSNQVDLKQRQRSNEAKARDAFQDLMGEFFQKRNARELRLHKVVAVLSKIAIPGKTVDPESIARRQSRRRKKT
jgi:hypothetical protein